MYLYISGGIGSCCAVMFLVCWSDWIENIVLPNRTVVCCDFSPGNEQLIFEICRIFSDFMRLQGVFAGLRETCNDFSHLKRLFETFWDFFWAEDGTGDANAASGSKNARQILWSLKSLWKSREVRQKSLKSHQVRRKIAASTLSHPWANKTRSAWLPTRQSAKFAKYSFRSSSRIPKIRSGVHRKSHWRQSKKQNRKSRTKQNTPAKYLQFYALQFEGAFGTAHRWKNCLFMSITDISLIFNMLRNYIIFNSIIK